MRNQGLIMKTSKFQYKTACGNVMETSWHVYVNGSAAETRNSASFFILHVARRNRLAETQRNFEPSGFRNFSESQKHLISTCVNLTQIDTCGDNKENGGSLQSRRITCQRLSNDGFMLCIVTNPALLDRENFVLCFTNIVWGFANVVLCFENIVLCSNNPCCVLINFCCV